MFDANADFFENTSCYIDYEKKLKYHVTPKDAYNLQISPNIKSNVKYCALQLKPTKLSETSLDITEKKWRNKPIKKQKHHRKHGKKHDKKSKRNSQEDDSILTGLQTVIDLCGLLEKYENKSKQKKKTHDEVNLCTNKNDTQNKILRHENENEINFLYETKKKVDSEPRYDTQIQNEASKNSARTKIDTVYENQTRNPQLVMKLATHKSSSSSRRSSSFNMPYEDECPCFDSYDYPVSSKTDRKPRRHAETSYLNEIPPSSIYTYPAIVDTSCAMDESKKDEPCEDHCSQMGIVSPAPLPPRKRSNIGLRRRFEEDDINDYWAKRHSGEAAKQATDSKAKKKPSKASIKKSRSLNVVKATSCSDKDCCVDGNTSVPCVRVKTSMGKEVCIKSKCGKALSAKCFPPVEIAPCDLSCSECYAVGDADPKLFNSSASECDCKQPSRVLSRKSVVFQAHSACAPKKVPIEFKKSRLGFPIPQPVVGFCNNCKCGGDNVSIRAVKYAMVKITEFASYATYEVMQPSTDIPKHMPSCISEIFVLARQQQNMFTMKSASLERPCSHQDIAGGSPSTRISFREPPLMESSQPKSNHDLVRVCSGQDVHTIENRKAQSPEPTRELSCREMPPSLHRFGTTSNVTAKKGKGGKKKKKR